MNLFYIAIGLDYDTYSICENEFRFEFQKKTSFISDYFSKKIRKFKFKTDGTFKMISISCNEYEQKPPIIVPFEVLKIPLIFNREKYLRISQVEDFSYYLELLEDGFKIASKFKTIPLEVLLNIIAEFKEGGCKNEWIHKKKRFKEQDLEITLICEFTTNYFQLLISVIQISNKKELVKGVVMRTETGVSIHESLYKNIVIEKDIIITDNTNSPRIKINLKEVFRNKLSFKIYGDAEIRKIMNAP